MNSTDLSKLFKDGILVQVHVSFWTGQRALTPEDLGLDPNTVSEAFVLGRKYLVNEGLISKFRTLDNKTRRILTESGFSFPIGGAAFIPRKRLDKVIDKLNAVQAEMISLRDGLCENYGKHQEEMIPVYKDAARVAFNYQEESQTEFSIEDREARLSAYTEQFLARVATFYPPVEVLRKKFAIDWSVFEVTPPSDKTQYASETWKQAIHDKMDTFVSDTVAALRAETLQVVDRVHAALTDGRVQARTFKSLTNFIAKFRDLNFIGDKSIEDQLDSLQKEVLDVYPMDKVRDEPEIQTAIIKRLVQIHEVAANVADIAEVAGNYKRSVVWQGDDAAPKDKAA